MRNLNLITENAVIGSLLMDNTTLDDIPYLQAEDFESTVNRSAYRAICSLINAGKNADIISSSEYLANDEQERDWFFELSSIAANSAYTPKNITAYADLVKQDSIDRKILSLAQKMISDVKEKSENRLDLAQQRIAELTDSFHFDTVQASDVFSTVLQRIDNRFLNPSDITGLSTGFEDVDKITHGLHGGHLIVLAARPSMGKTLLAMNIAEHVAVNEKKPVIIFSLEMNKEELLERSISSLGGIDADSIKTGRLTPHDFEKLSSLSPKYTGSKLFLEDRSGLNVSDIRARCRRIKREHGLSLVIVDYLTLVDGKGENETDKIGKISRGFKLLARDLNVPILLISQLNRGVEQRQEKRPTMADLRQSGSIEQDADLIWFIYRDEVYNKDTEYKDIAEINIAKNRHGSLGTIHLSFNNRYCRFDNHVGVTVPIRKPKQRASGFQYDPSAG